MEDTERDEKREREPCSEGEKTGDEREGEWRGESYQ